MNHTLTKEQRNEMEHALGLTYKKSLLAITITVTEMTLHGLIW